METSTVSLESTGRDVDAVTVTVFGLDSLAMVGLTDRFTGLG